MARFLVDENLTWRLVQALSTKGYEATDTFSSGLSGKPDEEVFAYAQKHSLTLITRDQGFGNPLLYLSGKHHAGIVVVRFPKEWTNSAVITHIIAAIHQLKQQPLADAVIVIEPARVRVRKGAKK